MSAVCTVEKIGATLSNLMIETEAERVTDNFDINVFNRGAYESEILPEEKKYEEWVLCPYSLKFEDDNYSIDQELSQFNLVLTLEEVRALTLGVAEEDGGDYISDNDFWIDSYSFKHTYQTIPKSVQTWIDFVTYNL